MPDSASIGQAAALISKPPLKASWISAHNISRHYNGFFISVDCAVLFVMSLY